MKREEIIQYAIQYQGSWTHIAKAIAAKEPVSFRHNPDACITILDEDYPASLKALRYPPWVLFYEGNISLLKRPMITIVGSRNLCDYGRRMTRLCASLLPDFVLVSGLARGADREVHQTAMQKGHTIGVIGSGLSHMYPYENMDLYLKMRETDLILTEYPHFTGIKRYHFPWRNRILAALGESIIVTQASLHSGTMITVNEGIELAKDIWCIPYPADEKAGEGCNKLISEGAGILYDPQILKDFRPHLEKY